MLFDDKSWLNDYADYGPFARASLGILVAKGDWSWWHDRTQSAVYEALHSALPKNGIAVWGGDEAVFNAQDWVDPALAIDLAQAFKKFSSSTAIHNDFRLRIERAVWGWGSVGDDINELRAYLAGTVPDRRVFFDWPQDRRPRIQKPDRQDGALVISTPSGGVSIKAGQAFTDALNRGSFGRVGDWRPREGWADVLVTKSLDTLTTGSVSAELIIIATDDQRTLVRSLDKIRSSTGAKCVVRVQESGNERWLEAFARLWVGRYSSIDTAAAQASDEADVDGEVVVSNRTFLLRSRGFLYSKTDDSVVGFSDSYELRPPAEVTDISVPEYDRLPRFRVPEIGFPEEMKPLATPPPPTARVLEINAIDSRGKKLGTLPSSGEFDIAVAVCPKTPLTRNLVSFPDQKVAWDGDKRMLQVHLLELGRPPVTKELVMPRTGASPPVSFQYLIQGAKLVDLRFMICDGAQILQTSRFQGYPGEKYTAKIETDFTPLEDKPRTFDMALLVNDSLGGRPSITTINDDRITLNILDESEVKALSDKVRQILNNITANPSASFDKSLKRLANNGSLLLRAIQKNVGNWPTSFTRIQLMTKVNAFFPFEFLYEGSLPDEPDAPVCPQSKDCLSDSRETVVCCPKRAIRDVFCPMGFVGLNAVVERHTWDRNEIHPLWVRRSEELSRRRPLQSLNEIVFAASRSAESFAQDDNVTIDDVEKAFGVSTKVRNWHDWRKAVVSDTRPPAIAVLVPHFADEQLFIGEAYGLFLANLSVGKASVAIVVGCNTVANDVAVLSLPNAIINQGEAKVVIGALTEILGRQANKAVMILATKIREASQSVNITTVGDLITDLRRTFLAQNMTLGLALIAVGDADVVLGGPA